MTTQTRKFGANSHQNEHFQNRRDDIRLSTVAEADLTELSRADSPAIMINGVKDLYVLKPLVLKTGIFMVRLRRKYFVCYAI